MNLLEKISSPAVQQKYIDRFRLQIKNELKNVQYNAATRPRCSTLEEVLSSAVSSSASVSHACCDLLEELVREGVVDGKYAAQQLQATLACALDSPGSVVTHIAQALCLLPRVSPIRSFSHPLLLLLNEYPAVWPQVLSLLESWLSGSTEKADSDEVRFVVLHSMLRPEWPLEHAFLRMRVNQLLLKDFDRWRSLVHRYSRWIPLTVPSIHLLQVGQLLADNSEKLGGIDSLLVLLTFFREISLRREADFSYVLQAALQIAHSLEDEPRNAQLSVTLLVSSLLISSGRLYGLRLLELIDVLFSKRLLPAPHHIALALYHSPVASNPAAQAMLPRVKRAAMESQGAASFEQIRSIPADLLAAVKASREGSLPEAVLAPGIPALLQGIVAAGRVVTCPDTQLSLWINLLKDLARSDCDTSCLAFFAIALRLEAETRPKNALLLLESFPEIAQNKISAVLVRNMLFSISSGSAITDSSVAPLSNMALVLLARLYVQHDTLTVPALLRAINVNSDDNQPTLETALAKALAIRAIVQHSPWLHGKDTLPCLARLLSLRSSEMFAVISVCFEAVRVLIENDIISLPSFLRKYSPVFTVDPRPQVKAAFYRMMSLLPLKSSSEAELLAVQKKLWLLVFSDAEDVAVRAACIEVLHSFPNLFAAAVPDKQAAEFSPKLELSQASQPDGVLAALPAAFITAGPLFQLCAHTDSPMLQDAFSRFIAERIQHEVKILPRSGVTHREERRSPRKPAVGSTFSSCLAQIPRLQQSFFHQNSPSIRPHVAAGLLLTYNPPVKTDQNGIATKGALVQHSNSFLTMFHSLIDSVPLFDEKDWFQSFACLQQWHLLVERAFISLVNGRKADRDNNEQAKLLASLWARDQLVATAAEGDSMNGLIAICSLVTIVHDFEKTLKLKERLQMTPNIGASRSEYLSHSEWPLRALRSLMQLAQRKPIEDVYFANILATFTRSASLTEKAVATVLFSLHQMLPLLQSQGLVETALNCFHTQARPQEAFLIAVGAGLLIQKLALRGLMEVAENTRKICEDLLQKFETWTFDAETGNVVSASYLFATMLALSGLCVVRSFHGCTQAFCSRIIRLLRACSPHSSPSGEGHEHDFFDQIALCCAVTAINGRQVVWKSSASNANSVEGGEQKALRDLAAWLTQKRSESPANAGVAIALGLILHSMAEYDAGCSESQPEKAESHRLVEALLSKVWLPVVANSHESVAHKTAAVRGIAALTGALDHLIVQKPTATEGHAWDITKVLTRDVTTTLLEAMIRDVNATSQAVAEAAVLKAHHLWTLGLFHRTLTAPLSSEPETVFPSTLNLPSSDQSGWVLAEVVMTAVKELRSSELLVAGLGQTFSFPLPCFAWIQLRRQLLCRDRQLTQLALVRLALRNSKLTRSLVPLLEACISPVVLDALQDDCKDELLDGLRTILEVCNPTRLGPFLALYRQRRLNSEDIELAENAWKVLSMYLRDPEADPTCVSLVQELACMALVSSNARFYVAACLVNLKDATLRDLILQRSLSGQDKTALRKALELRMAFAGVLEMSVVENPFKATSAMSTSVFAHFVAECCAVNFPAVTVENSVKWLLEVLPQPPLSRRSVALLSLLAFLITQDCDPKEEPRRTLCWTADEFIELLPYHVDQMTQSQIWGETAVEKFLEWLVSVAEKATDSDEVYPVLHDALMTFRGKQAFRTAGSLWNRAIQLPFPP